jgi:8-amino-7-oxononanoate synthase
MDESQPMGAVTASALDYALQPELAARREAGLWRSPKTIEAYRGTEVLIDGRWVMAFASNDYLGFAQDRDSGAALSAAALSWGSGSGAAHLISGHSKAHQQLEDELAAFLGYSRALLFSTGYMANLAVHTALLGKDDRAIQDRLNHASLIDAAQLSGATLLRYQHADPQSLERQLQRPVATAESRSLVSTDGVFSMDGDIAPLPALADECRCGAAWLMVDEAHALGVIGPQGRGSVAQFDLSVERVPIVMGTLGKALGSFGAFVAGSEALIETLIQNARSYIYTTATPPALAEATRMNLKRAAGEEGEQRREQLQDNIAQFRQGATQLGLQLMPSTTAIQPVVVGEAKAASALSAKLLDAGFWVPAIRPPTVPEGSARLRVSLSALHTQEQIERLLAALGTN